MIYFFLSVKLSSFVGICYYFCLCKQQLNSRVARMIAASVSRFARSSIANVALKNETIVFFCLCQSSKKSFQIETKPRINPAKRSNYVYLMDSGRILHHPLRYSTARHQNKGFLCHNPLQRFVAEKRQFHKMNENIYLILIAYKTYHIRKQGRYLNIRVIPRCLGMHSSFQ